MPAKVNRVMCTSDMIQAAVKSYAKIQRGRMTGAKPYLIAIAGPSCAGKTLLAQHLARLLSASLMPFDSYYRDRSGLTFDKRVHLNFDTPEAFDIELLTSHLQLLAQGVPVETPVYDFTQHVRSAEVKRIDPGEYIIVEGILSLYWEEVRRVYNLSVFLSAPDALCFERRLGRDVRERARAPESVREQYLASVRPAAEEYILPTMLYADLVLSGELEVGDLAATVLEKIKSGATKFPA
jgi:uridine kinase